MLGIKGHKIYVKFFETVNRDFEDNIKMDASKEINCFRIGPP
jgi:hypothetical protein